MTKLIVFLFYLFFKKAISRKVGALSFLKKSNSNNCNMRARKPSSSAARLPRRSPQWGRVLWGCGLLPSFNSSFCTTINCECRGQKYFRNFIFYFFIKTHTPKNSEDYFQSPVLKNRGFYVEEVWLECNFVMIKSIKVDSRDGRGDRLCWYHIIN